MTEVFLTLTEVFPCFFLSRKANARVKFAKTGHGPHSSIVFVLFGCYLCCSTYCLCVNVYCHQVTTRWQLINVSKCKSTFQFSNLAKYGHGGPEDGFKGDRNVLGRILSVLV